MTDQPAAPAHRLPRLAIVLALLATSLGVAACGEDGGSSETEVVASTTQLADIAGNVAGDRADVIGILPANADPHDYEPRPSDAESIAGADLVLQSGGDLDLWLDELVESSGTDAPVEAMLDSVRTIEGGHAHSEVEEHAEEAEDSEHAEEEEEHAEGEDEVDPHWWQDPRNAVLAAERIRDRLIEVDPEGRSEYEANAADYVERLGALDREIASCIERIPEAERKLVTSHDALGYFADRYGIEVVGAVIPALTTQAQPSAGETQELVELIREEDVNAVFPEAGVNPGLEETVAEETGAEIGGELWADALGPDGSTGATYLDAIAHNANELAAGLTGDPGACDVTSPAE